ncbi:sulfurtransferase [Auraticoccus monumenti]|uniref:Thiosulfate/3-mercaptopyruvate sulfurtransferase n=1 Tax=Auraticoccus monumenti TaxID=675864 RepID=A0A1G7CFT7_9ACTN|nr:sulfurtransferase [Auraticoccus monumenti]SDE38208.1 thiosulfate/3-mercaptopyruvate sulfurtransferase [Auraticoccus monumenti]
MSRRWMITVTELVEQLDQPGADRPLVLDARYDLMGPDGAGAFAEGHVPGARWVDVEDGLSATGERARGGGGRHPLPRPEVFEQAVRRVGLDRGRPVVAMDGGHLLGAARLWWLLRDAGHDAVRVLDGGFAAWRDAGLPVETGPGTPPAPGDFVAGPPRLPVVDAEGVAGALAGGVQVVDVRAAPRYRGEQEPIDPVAGHVPGAVNLPSSRLLGEDGRLLPAGPLHEVVADVAPGAVLYCGSGLTASQAVLALAETGREDGVLYAGSWSDWISDPTRPVARGH